MHWILHSALCPERYNEINDYLLKNGDTVTVLHGKTPVLPEPTESDTFYFLPLPLARKAHSLGFTNNFGNPKKYETLATLTHFSNYHLNQDSLFTSWNDFKRKGQKFWSNLYGNSVFIRPNSGQKTFTGQVIKFDDSYEISVDILETRSGVSPTTLIAVSSEKPIDNAQEWRVWLGNGSILGYSEYSWENQNTTNQNPPNSILMMAQSIAQQCNQEDFQFYDPFCVADFCISQGNPYLIEFNSITSSGFYSVKKEILFPNIKKTLKELMDNNKYDLS